MRLGAPVKLALVLAIAASTVAHAQPSGAQAEVLFRQGRELMTAGKYAEACSAFQQSQKLEPAVATLLNLAGCREKVGQIATAWGLFLDAERQTRGAADAASQQLHDVARDKAAKLEPRVSKLTINVPKGSQIDGLEIVRDDERVESIMWNRALPVDGGRYTITARARGVNPWSAQVTVGGESDAKTVDIPDLRTVGRDVEEPPHAEPIVAPKPEPHDDTPSKPLPIVSIALGAGAVALAGGAIGFEVWGQSTYDKAKAEMSSQSRRDSLESSANTKRYIAEGMAVAGVGSAGLAVWQYLRGRGEPTSTAIRVVPTGSGFALAGSY
jgi:serine/threonine-protein kinase